LSEWFLRMSSDGFRVQASLRITASVVVGGAGVSPPARPTRWREPGQSIVRTALPMKSRRADGGALPAGVAQQHHGAARRDLADRGGQRDPAAADRAARVAADLAAGSAGILRLGTSQGMASGSTASSTPWQANPAFHDLVMAACRTAGFRRWPPPPPSRSPRPHHHRSSCCSRHAPQSNPTRPRRRPRWRPVQRRRAMQTSGLNIEPNSNRPRSARGGCDLDSRARPVDVIR
jgi:hypothetical protein